MIELLVLITLGKLISRIMRSKGRAVAPYVVMLLLMWFAGEIAGAVATIAFTILENPGATDISVAGLYLGCLAGAAIGGTIAMIIVHSMSSLKPKVIDQRVMPGRHRL